MENTSNAETISKTCRQCGETKPIDGFHKDPVAKDGHKNFCRDCVSVLRKRKIVATTPKEKTGTSLDFLARTNFKGQYALKITVELAVAFQEYLKNWYDHDRLKVSFKEAFKTFAASNEISAITLYGLKAELVKAGKAGMTIEEYFEAGRPFSVRNKKVEPKEE